MNALRIALLERASAQADELVHTLGRVAGASRDVGDESTYARAMRACADVGAAGDVATRLAHELGSTTALEAV